MAARICRQICRAVAQVLGAACHQVAWFTTFSKLRLQFLRFSMWIDCVIIMFSFMHQVDWYPGIVKNRFGNVEEMMSLLEVARMVIIRVKPQPLV